MSTELTQQAQKPVIAMLSKYQGQIEAVLPKHLTPTRVLKMIVGAINKTPALLNCTPMSVINAVLTASQLGLEIGPGSAYLIPFGKECTLLIDYRGKIDLAQRTGRVLDIDLEVVYSKDKFRIFRDESGHKRLEHEPVLFREGPDGEHLPITEKDRGVPIGAYAMAILKDGPPKIVFMPAIDIDAIKARGRSSGGGPWKTDTMEMWKKTVCHRICKTLPSSAEKSEPLRQSQEIDDKFEMGESLDRVIEFDATDDPPQLTAGPEDTRASEATAAKTEALSDKLKNAKKDKAEPAATAASPVVTEPTATTATAATAQPAATAAKWPDRQAMNADFNKQKARIGQEAFDGLLSKHSVLRGSLKHDEDKAVALFADMVTAPMAVVESDPF